MAKSVTQNGITFNNYNNSEYLPLSRTVRLGTNEGLDEDNFGIVNAVDIAWNGAVLPKGDIANGSSKTINTTGDLLKLIDTMNEQIYALAAAVIAIGSKVPNE